MIVWGGILHVYKWAATPIGGVYDPATDTWTTTTAAGAPEGRWFHSAVSTGSKMIVWGGWRTNGDVLDSGGIYDPATDTWTPTATSGAPSARAFHTAVWTGSKMIVWGGNDATGGVFDPATNTWKPTSTLGAPIATGFPGPVAVWTGAKMIVWGGILADGSAVDSGALYDLASDTWTPMSRAGAPSPRGNATAVWTGTRMIVWGGSSGPNGGALGDGRIYDPAQDRWSEVASVGAPAPRMAHAAVWTGSTMVVWGGHSGVNSDGAISTYFNSGGIYDDPAVLR